jgi:hypothetical protein
MQWEISKMLNPDDAGSASTRWLRHYILNDCPVCFVAELAKDSRFCAKGLELRAAALAEFKAIPKPPKKRPADTSFNPSIEGRR